MTGNSASRNIRLGVFVVSGTFFLITGLYLIGSKRNLFGSTFTISARFHNVSGLMSGNNVRFAGIDVGTVEGVFIENDSTVHVVMILEKKVQPFIRKNAVAAVGTDGLMGNKLVNINSMPGFAPGIGEGDVLSTLRPVETDEMLRTLDETNENMKDITDNLHAITDRIESKNSLWSLLMDTVVAENVKMSVIHLRSATSRGAHIADDLQTVINDVRAGRGSLGMLITDTSFSGRIDRVALQLETFSDSAAVISAGISRVVGELESGRGAVGALLRDTTLSRSLIRSMENIRTGSESLNENLEALRHSWPFRKYFRKKEKGRL